MAVYLDLSAGLVYSQFAGLGFSLMHAIVNDLQKFGIGAGLDFGPVGFAARYVRRHYDRTRGDWTTVKLQVARVLMKSSFCFSPIPYCRR